MLEREKHDREQMNMIHKTIISQGLARDDHIVFVHGRGQGLNPTCTMHNSFPAKGFKMYSPNAQSAPSSDDNGNYFMALLDSSTSERRNIPNKHAGGIHPLDQRILISNGGGGGGGGWSH